MKTTNHRLHRLSAIILSTVFVFISCTKVTTPEPSENPVFLTYEAQTKQITVENMVSFAREDATDEIIIDDYISIQNDWVRLTRLEYVGYKTRVVQINVKENTTGKPRSHTVSIGSGTKNIILTVIQGGKP